MGTETTIPPNQKLSLTIEEASKLTSIPVSALRWMIQRGELKTIVYGGRSKPRRVIRIDELRAALERMEREGAA